MRIDIDLESLRGTNAAVDLEASWRAYRDELRSALKEAFPDVEITVECSTSTVVHDTDPETALRVQGIARAVRHCANWVVYED